MSAKFFPGKLYARSKKAGWAEEGTIREVDGIRILGYYKMKAAGLTRVRWIGIKNGGRHVVFIYATPRIALEMSAWAKEQARLP